MSFQYKDMAEMTAKVLALRDERVHYWNDSVSKASTAMTVANIMAFRSQYYTILNYLVAEQLIKGFYTAEAQRVAQICQDEINECDKALSDCVRKVFEDKITSRVTEFLSQKINV